MKKLLILMILAALALLAACTPQLPPQPQEYTVSPEQVNTAVVSVRSEAPEVAAAELLEDGSVRVTSCSEGTAQLRLVTPYGESFTMGVECDAQLNISVTGGYVPPKAQVTATDFGAIPDDGKDDTAAIQAAMDSLTEGGAVYIPKGVYSVGRLILRENVALRLEGVVQEPALGYEASGAYAMIQSGDYAVLQTKGKTDMFLNHENRDYGSNGCDGFRISGGVLDMQGSRRCLVLSCAEDVVLENIVFLDGPNNHVIQLGGCKNVTVRDCIFAGYNYKTNNTGAEAIQIEQTHPGAMGGVSNTPSVFDEGEHYFCENVQIVGCWFGPSESYDSPTYAIGHHGQGYRSSVTGLVIRDCVFDNCRCSAISYPAFSDVTIRGNTFINDRDNCVSKNEKLSQINLFLYNNDISAPNTSGDGVKALYAKKDACVGSINTVIEDNTFILGAECGKYSAVSAVAHGNNYDVLYDYGTWLVSEFGQAPVYYTGLMPVRNVISNLTVRNNCVQVHPDCETDGYFYHFTYIKGLALEGNRVEGKVYEDCSSKMEDIPYANCRIIGCTSLQTRQEKITLQVPRKNLSGSCVLVIGDKRVPLAAADTPTVAVTVRAQGGVISYEINAEGVLEIRVTPRDGKVFKGIELPSSAKEDPDGTCLLAYSSEILVIFE